MNTLWAILLLVPPDGPLSNIVGAVNYASLEACMRAKSEVSAALNHDYKLFCVETDIPSGSMRPLPRPEGVGE